MKRIVIALLVCFIIQTHFIQADSNLSKLKKECLLGLRAQKSLHTSTICSALNGVDSIVEQKKRLCSYCDDPSIISLFEVSDKDDYVVQAQYFVVAKIYRAVFISIIHTSTFMLKNIHEVITYWEVELFKYKSSWLKKTTSYWYRGSAYIEELERRIEQLKDQEKQLATLLGVAAYGLSTLDAITTLHILYDNVPKAISPLYEFFNQFLPGNVATWFYDGEMIHTMIASVYCHAQESVKFAKIPHHIVRHWGTYSCGAACLLTTLFLYKTYEKDISRYVLKLQDSAEHVLKEYIVDPLVGLKEVLWDKKSQEITQPKFVTFDFDEKQKIIEIAELDFGDMEEVLNNPLKPLGELPELDVESLRKHAQTIQDQIHKVKPTDTILKQAGKDFVQGLVPTGVGKSIYGYFAENEQKSVVADKELSLEQKQELLKLYLQNPSENLEGFAQATMHVIFEEVSKLEMAVNESMKKLDIAQKESIEEFNALKKIVAQELLSIKKLANELIRTMNNMEILAKGMVKTLLVNYDQKMKLVEESVNIVNEAFLKRQWVNIYLAAIGPVLAAGYVSYKLGSRWYDKSYYANYIKPMCKIVRELDVLLNSVLHKTEHDFFVDGKLYYLVWNLKSYIACLDIEEQQQMLVDIKDLTSLHFSYVQKQKVVDRIYRTYEFIA